MADITVNLNVKPRAVVDVQTAKVATIDLGVRGGSGSGTDDYNRLRNKPSINGVELIGDKTSEDLGLSTFVFEQAIPSDEWRIQHTLNKYPSVSIVDSGLNVVVGDVTYIDKNNLVVNFIGAFSGKAFLN